mgnify:CR=1 FL=1
MLCYCDKCGNLGDWVKPEDHSCFCCGNSPLKPIPRKYIDNFRWRDGDGKEAFMEEVVKKSPNLDKTLFEHRDEIIQRKNNEMKASIDAGRAILEEKSRIPKCPYCQSTNLKKITGLDRFISVGLFGLASKKVGKQWHCNNCKSDF